MNLLMCKTFDDAVVAYLVKRWNEKSKLNLGRTTIQKLCYFAKAKGVPLDYKFDMYRYGPYCQTLYYRMDDLVADKVLTDEMTGTLESTQSKTPSSKYLLSDNSNDLFDLFHVELSQEKNNLDHIVVLLENCSPRELELFSTTHYCFHALSKFSTSSPSIEETIKQVMKVKKDRFNEDAISMAYDALSRVGLLS